MFDRTAQKGDFFSTDSQKCMQNFGSFFSRFKSITIHGVDFSTSLEKKLCTCIILPGNFSPGKNFSDPFFSPGKNFGSRSAGDSLTIDGKGPEALLRFLVMT
jgi:hypothetical protein